MVINPPSFFLSFFLFIFPPPPFRPDRGPPKQTETLKWCWFSGWFTGSILSHSHWVRLQSRSCCQLNWLQRGIVYFICSLNSPADGTDSHADVQVDPLSLESVQAQRVAWLTEHGLDQLAHGFFISAVFVVVIFFVFYFFNLQSLFFICMLKDNQTLEGLNPRAKWRLPSANFVKPVEHYQDIPLCSLEVHMTTSAESA